MRTSTKLIRLCAVVPAGLAGSFVAVIGLGFLPDAGLVFAFLGTLMVSIVLACGWLEAPAARTSGSPAAFVPGSAPCSSRRWPWPTGSTSPPGGCWCGSTDTDGLPATPIGRRTVIVEPWLVQGLYERRLTAADAATAIGHAVASQRVGPSRFDLAARLWAFPWTLVFRRHPSDRTHVLVGAGRRVAWHLRIVVGVVAVYQGFQPGGNPTLGVATGVLVAISYVGTRSRSDLARGGGARRRPHRGPARPRRFADPVRAVAPGRRLDGAGTPHPSRCGRPPPSTPTAEAPAPEVAGARVLTHPTALR